MARIVFIEIDTTLNYAHVTDLNDSGMAFDSYSALGWGFVIERANTATPLNNAGTMIKIHTPLGQTGFFEYNEFAGLTVDGAPVVVANLQDVVDNLSPYFFA